MIELHLDSDGNGEGKMSLAADVVFDAEAGTVALENYESTPTLLETVTSAIASRVSPSCCSMRSRRSSVLHPFTGSPS